MKTLKIDNLKSIIAISAIASSLLPLNSVQAQNSQVPEIGWESRLSSMGLDKVENIGQSYSFFCQAASEGLIHSPIWGTETYTLNSSICTSAVHSGMITSQKGGEVTVKLLEGQQFYTGSNKNGITSQDNRSTSTSFSFIGDQIAQSEKFADSSQDKEERPSGIERVVVNGLQRGVERSLEKVITEIFK